MGYDTIDHGLLGLCGLHSTLRNELTRKAPCCWDRSRQSNKGHIGNTQYGRVKTHF
jgi:hypothetical protein